MKNRRININLTFKIEDMKTEMRKGVILIALTVMLPFLSGAQEVVDKSYYDNGQLQTVVFQVGENFLMTNYFANGQLKDKVIFTGTERNGKFQSWHSNGQKHMSGEFVNNKPSGQWKVWNAEGQIIGSAHFENGNLATGSLWDESGTLIADR